MRLFLPIVFTALFILYVLYLAFIKKNLRANLTQIIYPGLFFVAVWILLYFLILK